MRTNSKFDKEKLLRHTKKFSMGIQTNNPTLITVELSREINLLSTRLNKMWDEYIKIILEKSSSVSKLLQKIYDEHMRKIYCNFIFSETAKINKDKYLEDLRINLVRKYKSNIPVNNIIKE